VILGSLITAIFGAEALNELSTSVWFNLIFFLLLVVFALSFLGAFEIVLPSSWATKIDSQADKGGILGIVFMALALAVVSFSCTGPIVGTLLVESASKGGIAPIVGMFGFSLAIALPFMLFAMFPGWLNSMPKSGGWLNTVKVSLGFLELAFAFKFLSNADLVLQKHWLERELFIAIWIAIFGAWALYLFGKYMLPHDYERADKIGVGRLIMAVLVTTFTFYMIPGLWGAPLKILSGLTPPINYAESVSGFGNNAGNKTDLPENAHLGPHGIIAFEDYEHGLAYAKQVNKPVLLDFTGDACANCRKMEDNVWSDASILPILKEKVVLISLYCDRKIELPKEQQYVSKTTGKEVVTIGNKWTDFQITRYKSNSQPLYVILDTNGNDLSKPIAFTFDKQEYLTWLKDGISKFN
jgi:thiol:disulfide interchange protein DsbD